MLSLLLQRVDHRDADAVLDAADRVEEFELEQQVGLHAGRLRHARHAHQRRIADGLGDGVEDAAAAGLCVSLFTAMPRGTSPVKS